MGSSMDVNHLGVRKNEKKIRRGQTHFYSLIIIMNTLVFILLLHIVKSEKNVDNLKNLITCS